ncbi:hypothetical protein Lesp02_16170 [Lentzea sp. NBRC 105346]|uniref:hypothetical protein n=1 Tax=Lentzea sp. NBRC 105346 TaxID=3032205 RepID=UPI0024A526F7|nr:hypothetical protein [Lentzea sp. NBRC 105346]GLZ29427.1 hypothetical protein Lesp02_16170 [Lentzea sp. NBRC 105346]
MATNTKPGRSPSRGKWQGYRTIFSVDAMGSTKWTNGEKEVGRALMYRLVGDAFESCGIKPHYCDPLVDRGDGILALIRPLDEVPKTLVLGTMIPKLRELLAGEVESELRSPLRLRAVLHAGEVHDDGRGPFGEALDSAFRLLESREVKRFDEVDSPLLLVISDDIYRTVVLQYFAGEAIRFEPIRRKDDRNGNVYRGWVLSS